jgi:hypothetical protein
MPTWNTVPHQRTKTAAEVRNAAVSFVGKLDSGELLTGTPTVTVSPSGPTLSNKAVNTAQLTIDGQTVAIGQAVQFSVSGGTAGTSYVITVQCGTTATPAQTLEAFCNLKVVSD